MTPWLQLALTVLAAVGAATLVRRRSRNWTLAVSTGLFVLAVASFLPGTANSAVILLMGLPLMMISLGGFLAAWIGHRRRAGASGGR